MRFTKNLEKNIGKTYDKLMLSHGYSIINVVMSITIIAIIVHTWENLGKRMR